MALFAPPAVVAPAPDLAAYRWKKRVVVLFAATEGDPRLARQRATLADLTRESDDRDLALVTVVGDRVTGSADPADALRRRLRAPPGVFRAVLVGKDGGVKLAERAPIDAARLAETIDAMPMRRDEMRR